MSLVLVFWCVFKYLCCVVLCYLYKPAHSSVLWAAEREGLPQEHIAVDLLIYHTSPLKHTNIYITKLEGILSFLQSWMSMKNMEWSCAVNGLTAVLEVVTVGLVKLHVAFIHGVFLAKHAGLPFNFIYFCLHLFLGSYWPIHTQPDT